MAGYAKVREAMEMVINMVSKCAPNIVLVCHTKDSAIADSDVTVKGIDLAGKSGRVLSSKSDAIGFLYRDVYEQEVKEMAKLYKKTIK